MKKYIPYITATLYIIVIIIFLLQLLHKADGENDFSSYILSSEALIENSNPYATDTPFPYIYPLFLATILIPFTFLPLAVSQILWYIINIISLLLIIYLMANISGMNNKEGKTYFNYSVLLLTSMLILFNPIQIHLINGQVNLLVLAASVVFIVTYHKNKYISAIALGSAIALKLVPLIFLLYIILRRDVKHLLIVIASVIALTIMIPLIFTGGAIAEYYRYYVESFILTSVNNQSDGNSAYFTLAGFLKEFFNFEGIIPVLISLISLIIPVIYKQIKEKDKDYLRYFSLYALLMLLISPSSQTHHLVYLLPGIVLLAIEGMKRKGGRSIIYLIVFGIVFWMGMITRESVIIFSSLLYLYMALLKGKFNIHRLEAADSER
jgi:hypothetical protein